MDITLQRIEDFLSHSKPGNKGLAKHLGISPNNITNWKGGLNKSYNKYLKQIAEYFETSEAYLKGETDEKSPQPTAEDFTKEDFDFLKLFKTLPLEEQDAILTLAKARSKNTQGLDE